MGVGSKQGGCLRFSSLTQRMYCLQTAIGRLFQSYVLQNPSHSNTKLVANGANTS